MMEEEDDRWEPKDTETLSLHLLHSLVCKPPGFDAMHVSTQMHRGPMWKALEMSQTREEIQWRNPLHEHQ